jgi:hypothetical protein
MYSFSNEVELQVKTYFYGGLDIIWGTKLENFVLLNNNNA